MKAERVIEMTIGLYEGPTTGGEAPPAIARAILEALHEHGYELVRPITSEEEREGADLW